MAKVLSSISGNLISAASAGFAPTNSADVSAIASAYQVVSATATQLYAGTSYVTSINTAPISASRAGQAANASMATSAYYDGTGRLISSLPDSATVSAIASAYATAKVDKSSISAQSAQWNSVYNTVNLNSASWSGSTGGGSVTSPSGTIFVKDGTAIEGTNSAALTASNGGFSAELYPAQDHINPAWSYIAIVSLPESGGTLTIPTNGLWGCTAIFSGLSVDGLSTESASASATNGAMSLVVELGGIAGNISASSNNWVNIQGFMTAEKARGVQVTGVGELAWKSAVDNVTNTVANNSASWAQGLQYGDKVSHGSNTIGLGKSANTNTDAGIYLSSTHGSGFYKVNEMTLNRTSYGETVNFNLGSAGSQVRVSASGTRGGYFSAWNDSASAALMVSGSQPVLMLGAGTATDSSISSWNDCYDTVSANSATWGQGGVDSATVSSIASSYAESAVSSKLDSSASSSFYTTANESGFVDSSYVDSSVSGKADSSSLSSYALSADVSGTVDVVSTQSANWGGSALALSAGPGIYLTMVGNTLVISTAGV